VLKKLGGDDGAHGVRTKILRTGIAVTVPVEASEWLDTAHFKWLAVDVALLHNATVSDTTGSESTEGTEPRWRHARPTPVGSLVPRLIVGALAALLLVTGGAFPAQASSALAPTTAEIRTNVVDLTRSYSDRYGPRVAPGERRELRAMTREARREMNRLVRLVNRADRTKAKRDWRRAQQHYAAIRVTGDERLNRARVILAKQMSLGEQLEAAQQALRVMQSLDSLGAELSRRAR